MKRAAAAVATAVLTLALPATSQAADYFNGSQSRGAWVITGGGYIQHFEIYCNGRSFSTRQLAFSMAGAITIGRHGRYSYRGIAYEYGPERQPLGQKKVRVSGKLTSKKVTAKFSVPGCKRTKGSLSAGRG
jgi:hypothetical protein